MENFFTERRYGMDYVRRDYTSQYTGLVEDLIDDGENTKCNVVSKKLIKDKVSGFSMISIEEAFFQNKTFSGLKNYLMENNPSGKKGVKYTKTDINNLFKCWGLE